jgi:large subunit ribosomal protein L4
MPKKAARKAMASVLSAKLAEGELTVIEKFGFSGPKTKEAAAFIAGLGLVGSTLVMDTGDDDNVYLSLRNLKDVKVIRVENVNLFDLLKYRNLLIEQDAINKLQQEVLK